MKFAGKGDIANYELGPRNPKDVVVKEDYLRPSPFLPVRGASKESNKTFRLHNE